MKTTQWNVDPSHSEIQFKVKHLMVTTVTGSFKEFQAQLEVPEEDFSNAKINFSAQVDSISTGSNDRDGHLKSPDFFDTATYPTITFSSTGFQKVGENEYELIGNFTVRGISKPTKLKVEYGGKMKDPWGNIKAGFSLEGKINRKDFGLNWNAPLETGGVLVSDEVRLLAELQFVQQS